MKLSLRRFLQATALLVGSMMGAGIFGIPFAFQKAGFSIGMLWLLILSVLVGLLYLLLGELTLSTRGIHQIPGYIGVWLGRIPRSLSVVTQILSLYGALLVYCILAGEFLQSLLEPVLSLDATWFGVAFAVLFSLLWLLRLRSIATAEASILALSLVAIAAILWLGYPAIDRANYAIQTFDLWYLPYGVLLFALSGYSSIPLQRETLRGHECSLRWSIIAAVVGVAVVYALFAALVVGVSGEVTSPSAIAGLYQFLGSNVLIVGSLLGLLTMSTSFTALGTVLFETFHDDARRSKAVAWFASLTPPLALYLSGVRNFIEAISLIGSVALGVQSVLLLASYVRARRSPERSPEYSIHVSTPIVFVIAGVFLGGIVLEVMLR